jgi:hypothetical protein
MDWVFVRRYISGDINYKLAEAYHDQGFSTSGYMVPLVRGLAGLYVDAVNNKISFHPQIPANWEYLHIKNIKLNDKRINLSITKIKNILQLNIVNSSADSINFEFGPFLSSGALVSNIILSDFSGKETKLKSTLKKLESSFKILTEFKTGKRAEIKYFLKPTVELYWLPSEIPLGMTNTGLKIISSQMEDNAISIDCYGIAGKTYYLGIKNQEFVLSVEGGKVIGEKLQVEIPDSKIDGFIKHHVVIKVKGEN